MGVQGATKRSQVHPGQQQAWQAMRIMRRFTHTDLLVTCPLLGPEASRKYVQRLRHCGYLQRVAVRQLGQPGSRDTFALVRNTGPLAPVLRRNSRSLFDPNTGTAHGAGGELLELPPPGRRRALKPVVRRALLALLQGRPVASVMTDPDNAGALAVLLGSLRKRDLVDAAGGLTDAGRTLAQALAAEAP